MKTKDIAPLSEVECLRLRRTSTNPDVLSLLATIDYVFDCERDRREIASAESAKYKMRMAEIQRREQIVSAILMCLAKDAGGKLELSKESAEALPIGTQYQITNTESGGLLFKII